MGKAEGAALMGGLLLIAVVEKLKEEKWDFQKKERCNPISLALETLFEGWK